MKDLLRKKFIWFASGFLIGVLSLCAIAHKSSLSAFPILAKTNYTLAYDTRGKIPFWVYEKITKEELSTGVSIKRPPFFEETLIYSLHRSHSDDYKNTGLDRAHMACAANHRHSKEEFIDTFSIANCCPKEPSLNRGLWNKLEKYTRILVMTHGEAEIITGPLFIPQEENGQRMIKYSLIGKSDVAVPNAFFKVIRLPNKKLSIYIIPNEKLKGTPPLDTFLSTPEYFETISGIELNSIFN